MTSQGMRRDEAQVLEKQPAPAEEVKSVLGGLWSQLRAATEVVAHMAQDAAVAVEHAGEKIVEQTKEIAFEAEHQAEVQAEHLKDIGSDIQAKAQVTLADVSHKLHDLSEVVIEQGHVVSEQAKEKASEILASDTAQIAISAGNSALEKSKSLGQHALAAGHDVIERTKSEGVSAEAQVLSEKTISAGEIFIEKAAAQLAQLAEQAVEYGQKALDSTEAPPAADLATNLNKLKKSASSRSASAAADAEWNGQPLQLTMDVVSHIQRIADRTGDAVLHETARKAHSACAKGLNEAPGVHLVWITPQQANDLVNLAIRTQDHELADFARYCQSVAATTHVGVEPSPGKIQQEIAKGHQELQAQGRVHTGPGYGAAFASVNRVYNNVPSLMRSVSAPHIALPIAAPPTTPIKATTPITASTPSTPTALSTPPTLALNMEVVSHIQRIADRTGNAVLHETARKAHSACAKGLSDAPGVHLVWVTPAHASELMNLASRTHNDELIAFARYCQSVAATTQVGVEPEPGKIQQEILKGRQDVQKLAPVETSQPLQPLGAAM